MRNDRRCLSRQELGLSSNSYLAMAYDIAAISTSFTVAPAFQPMALTSLTGTSWDTASLRRHFFR
eukprot:CAMPEP_0117671686 /NCGR_PEP_ID=MMETSP0804-20121206/13479_1 /TAXON_ID=1074897 /ORGANISM="Tetraselmis astigmatica, Strain CCMP880" /LENGTH=64 /DNA_ID=CAMNT_0005480189 /DNA_START=668 /DNA_END=862 /DNA_ORIENTATION=-